MLGYLFVENGRCREAGIEKVKEKAERGRSKAVDEEITDRVS